MLVVSVSFLMRMLWHANLLYFVSRFVLPCFVLCMMLCFNDTAYVYVCWCMCVRAGVCVHAGMEGVKAFFFHQAAVD